MDIYMAVQTPGEMLQYTCIMWLAMTPGALGYLSVTGVTLCTVNLAVFALGMTPLVINT